MSNFDFGAGVIAPPKPEAVIKSMCGLMQQVGFENDLLLRLFPARNLPDATQVRVQFQQIACGVQNWRGQGQTPEVVNWRMLQKECVYRPQKWGDKIVLDEETLENLPTRRDGNCIVYDPSQVIAQMQQHLLVRQFNRQRLLAADLLLYGKTNALSANTGEPMDGQSFPINKPNLSTQVWTDFANSTPFIDILNLKLQYEQNTLCSFGRGSRIIMHSQTFAWLQQNSNPANWAIFGQGFCCNRKTLCEINELLAGYDLPSIVLYDGWYLDCQGNESAVIPGASGQVSKKWLIPPGWVTWIGDTDMPRVSIPTHRDVEACADDIVAVGELFYTMNTNTCSGQAMSGPVSDLFWHCNGYPKKGEVIQAWNGMFAPTCPGCIISFPVK